MSTSDLLWSLWGTGILLLIGSCALGTLIGKWIKRNSAEPPPPPDEPIDPAAGLYRDGAFEDSELDNRR